MPLRLEITSYHNRRLKDASVKEFGTDGGTIGCSLETDWVLQDGNRYVSSRHAAIDFLSGCYYIIDTSRNGVYVNNATKPIGQAKPQRLFQGDRLRIGEYEMTVHLDETDQERMLDARHVDPVSKAQHVDSPEPTGKKLVGEHEMTSVGIEDLLLEGAEASALKRAALKAAAGMRLEDDTAGPQKPVAAQANKAPSKPAKPKASNADAANSPSVALYAFLRGAGLEPQDIDETQAAVMLHHLGQLMRELVIGVTDALHYRAEQKGKLRIPSTIIQPRENNVLKFSVSVDEALNALVADRESEYKSAIDSTREAFEDLKIHQQSMQEAVQIALTDFIDRLDPEELEQGFDHGMKRNTFIGAANKFRYWELYADVYQTLTQRDPGQLPQCFAEELSRSYEEEATLKGKLRQNNALDDEATDTPQADAG